MRLIAAMPLLILVSLMIAVVIEHHVLHRKWLTRGKAKPLNVAETASAARAIGRKINERE